MNTNKFSLYFAMLLLLLPAIVVNINATSITPGNYSNNSTSNITISKIGNRTIIQNLIVSPNSKHTTNQNKFKVPVSPSSVTLDVPQSITLTANPSGGTMPYFYQWYSGTSKKCRSDTVISGATNSSYIASPLINIYYCYKVTDSATKPQHKFSKPSKIKVNSTPTITIIPSNTILDAGQTETYTIKIKGGTGPFSVELYNITGSKQEGSNVIVPYDGSNTISFVASATGSFPFNAIATDTGTNAPYVFNSVSNTITVNPFFSISISPASNTLDANQQLSLVTTVSGGTSSFSIAYTNSNYLCGAPSSNSNTLSSDGSNTILFATNSVLTSSCSTIITASAKDSASSSNIIVTNSVLTVNPILGIPSISPNAINTIDEGQPITISANILSGTSPYTYNFIISNAINPSNIIYNNGSISNSLTANSVTWIPNTIGTFVANVLVTDSANTPETTNSVYSSNIVVNSAPTITITPSNTILDAGQTETYTININGGTGPFDVELYNITDRQQQGSNVIIPYDGSNTISFATSTNGIFIFNAIATDTGTTLPYTFNSTPNTITVNPILGIPSISPNSINTIDEWQPITISANILGGTSPYTYNFIISNTIDPSNIIYNSGSISNSLTANSVTWIPNTIGTFVANVLVTDSANTPETTNSVYSSNIVVNSTPTITITPSNTTLDAGQTETYTINIKGGTGPFSVELYNITGSKQEGSNVIIPSDGSNTISFATSTNGIFIFNAIATDTGTTLPYTFNSTPNTITVNPILGIPSISPNSINTIDEGQPITISANILGGTSPYTYNFIISNTIDPSNIIYNSGSISNSLTANSVTWIPNTIGTFVANVLVTDSANTPETTNSVYSSNIVVNPALTISFTPTGTTYQVGQFVQPNVILSNGNPINPANLSVTWTAQDPDFTSLAANTLSTTGTFSGTVSYIDGEGVTLTAPFSFTVNPAPQTYVLSGHTANVVVTLLSNTPVSVNYTSAGAVLSIKSTDSNIITANVLIANLTSSTSTTPSISGTTFTKLLVLNLSVNTSSTYSNNISYTLTVGYPCGSNAAPYKYNATTGAWVLLNYTTNTAGAPTLCTMSFTIPFDPVVGLFTSAPTPASGGTGGGGAGGGGNAGIKILPKTTLTSDTCDITNMSVGASVICTLYNNTFTIGQNFITLNESGTSVNTKGFTLSTKNNLANIKNSSGYKFYIKLLDVNYYDYAVGAPTVNLELSANKTFVKPVSTPSNSTTTIKTTTTTVPTTTIKPPTTIVQNVTKTTPPSSAVPPSSNTDLIIGILVLIIIAAIIIWYYSRKRRGGKTGKSRN